MDPFLSIVVCTRNRVAEALDCLSGLLLQIAEMDDVEVIVVDNASSDDTQERVEQFIAITGSPIVYMHEETLGSGNARNRGAREARGRVIAYIDDDEVPGAGWVSRIKELFLRPDVDSFCGTYIIETEIDVSNWFPRDLFWILGETRLGDQPRFLRPEEYAQAQTGNCALRKHVFDAVGGFNPKFRLYGDDSDFFRRVGQHGFSLLYDPTISIVQRVPKNRLTKASLRRKAYAWGRGSAMLSMLASPGLGRRAGGLLEHAARTAYVGGSMAFRSGFGREFTFWHNLGFLMQYAKGAR